MLNKDEKKELEKGFGSFAKDLGTTFSLTENLKKKEIMVKLGNLEVALRIENNNNADPEHIYRVFELLRDQAARLYFTSIEKKQEI